MSNEQELKDLSEEYGAALPEKLANIKTDWSQLQEQFDQTLLKELIRKVHSLTGSGATFGYKALSDAAATLELELRQYPEQQPPADYQDSTEPLLQAMDTAALLPCDYDISTDTSITLKETAFIEDNAPNILIIGRNRSFCTDLSNRLKAFNITSHVISDSSNLLSVLEQINPCSILIDLASIPNQVAEIEAIKEIKLKLFKMPDLTVISDHHNMELHLSAVRAGATAYFLAPVKVSELVTYLHSHCQQTATLPYRILIVDDEEQFSHHTALILQRAGMETYVLTNPLDILDPLTNFKPEVILLDLYMPECNGFEVSTIIRQQCIYAGIPIVFFSVETDIERHIDALRTGGNDFFVKPMSPIQLIAKVEAKAKNARTVQSLMLHDGLTGLLNRSYFMETINQQMAISQRNKSSFSYVMLDLDHFKQVNDLYGHHAGDEVLTTLSELTTQHLRSVDRVIRYGGEEIVILLSETNLEQARPVINALLKKFSGLTFTADNQIFSVTFSAGIAQYPTYSDPMRLAEAADKALYQAKTAGRNQICLA